jgi:hypothetical protein
MIEGWNGKGGRRDVMSNLKKKGKGRGRGEIGR